MFKIKRMYKLFAKYSIDNKNIQLKSRYFSHLLSCVHLLLQEVFSGNMEVSSAPRRHMTNAGFEIPLPLLDKTIRNLNIKGKSE